MKKRLVKTSQNVSRMTTFHEYSSVCLNPKTCLLAWLSRRLPGADMSSLEPSAFHVAIERRTRAEDANSEIDRCLIHRRQTCKRSNKHDKRWWFYGDKNLKQQRPKKEKKCHRWEKLKNKHDIPLNLNQPMFCIPPADLGDNTRKLSMATDKAPDT